MGAYPGAVFDLQVQSNGTIKDAVSGQLATITRLGPKLGLRNGLLTSVGDNLLAAEKYPNGNGWWAAIEESRTNSFTYSTFATQTELNTWTRSGALRSDNGGSATLGLIGLYGNEVILSNNHATLDGFFYKLITTAGETRTVSFYARKPDNSPVTTSDCSVLGNNSGGAPGVVISQVPGTTWYRLSKTFTSAVGGDYDGVRVSPLKTVIICCIQNEPGSGSTSFIPTASSAIVRPADTITFPTTGLITSQGSFVAVIERHPNNVGCAVGLPPASGSSNRINLMNASSGRAEAWFTGADGTMVAAYTATGIIPAPPNPGTIALRWSSSEVRAYAQGANGISQVTEAMNGMHTTFYVGHYGSSYAMNSRLHRILGFGRQLGDSEILAIHNSLVAGTSKILVYKRVV